MIRLTVTIAVNEKIKKITEIVTETKKTESVK